ncbi:MAG: hypothetical protein AVDCRST_MAG02-2797, partial [uncultured Rubrobacteraceae bacterium]
GLRLSGPGGLHRGRVCGRRGHQAPPARAPLLLHGRRLPGRRPRRRRAAGGRDAHRQGARPRPRLGVGGAGPLRRQAARGDGRPAPGRADTRPRRVRWGDAAVRGAVRAGRLQPAARARQHLGGRNALLVPEQPAHVWHDPPPQDAVLREARLRRQLPRPGRHRRGRGV